MKEKWKILILLALSFILLAIAGVIAYVVDEWEVFDDKAQYLSKSAFDFWSMGHLLAGMGIFMLAFTIYFIIKNIDKSISEPSTLVPPSSKKMFFSWLITLIAAIIWELLENTIFYWVGWKDRLDSAINISTDIILWSMGGIIAWYLTYLMFVSKEYIYVYYLFTLTYLITFFVIFILFGFITFGNL